MAAEPREGAPQEGALREGAPRRREPRSKSHKGSETPRTTSGRVGAPGWVEEPRYTPGRLGESSRRASGALGAAVHRKPAPPIAGLRALAERALQMLVSRLTAPDVKLDELNVVDADVRHDAA